MGWYQRALDRGVKAGVARAMEEATAPNGIIAQTMFKVFDQELSRTNLLTELGFSWAMAIAFWRHGATCAEAKALARDTYRDYLASEKIKFGDEDYCWTREGAEAVAEEYEIRHWEPAA